MSPERHLRTICFFQKTQTEGEKYITKLWRDFGQSIRRTRKQRKIKLSVFAKELGVTPAFVSYLESGSRKWNLVMARKAVKLVGKNSAGATT